MSSTTAFLAANHQFGNQIVSLEPKCKVESFSIVRGMELSFFRFSYDFQGAFYPAEDLETAREFFLELLQDYLPDWNGDSSSLIFREFSSEALNSAQQLIDLAVTLDTLRTALTPESLPAFAHKVKQLFDARDSNQYDELVAELTVGSTLSFIVRPIAWEPLERPLEYSNPLKNKSPDFGIRLPDAEVQIEVTTLRIGALDHWNRSMKIIRERVSAAFSSAGLVSECDIRAPFGVQAHELTNKKLRGLLERAKSSAAGSMRIELGPVAGIFTWRAIRVVEIPDGTSLTSNPFTSPAHFSAIVTTPGFKVFSMAPSRVSLMTSEGIENDLVRSIRNTIDQKRSQLLAPIQSLLILHIGNWQLTQQDVINLVEKRIWPNPQYHWLTGIGVAVSRNNFSADSSHTPILISWNRKPSIPRSESLRELVEDGVTFAYGARVMSKSGTSPAEE